MAENDVTRVLGEATKGSASALEELFDACYEELRRLARRNLAGERSDHTLQTTALVHEAYLRLVDAPRMEWRGRAQFFAVAARAMRRILVDHARRRARRKRDGKWRKLALADVASLGTAPPDADLLALDRALTRLQEREPEKARVVEMRFFAGMRTEEIAEVLGVTARTVRRYWVYAQARLYKDLTSESEVS